MPSREELIERGKKTQFKSGKQAAKSGKAGGVASGVAKREKRLMREILDELLSRKAGKSEMTYKEAIMLRTVKQAIDGNDKAREFIRDTIGEKPTEKTQTELTLTQALVEFVDGKSDDKDSGEVPPAVN